MTDARCDSCRHWDTEEPLDWVQERAAFRRCLAVQMRCKIEDSVQTHLTGKERMAIEIEAIKAARAYVVDGSSYYAALITGPDFHCALFEANMKELKWL